MAGLSPLLHSLTATVSTDSALVLAALLAGLHLFLYDYRSTHARPQPPP